MYGRRSTENSDESENLPDPGTSKTFPVVHDSAQRLTREEGVGCGWVVGRKRIRPWPVSPIWVSSKDRLIRQRKDVGSVVRSTHPPSLPSLSPRETGTLRSHLSSTPGNQGRWETWQTWVVSLESPRSPSTPVAGHHVSWLEGIVNWSRDRDQEQGTGKSVEVEGPDSCKYPTRL